MRALSRRVLHSATQLAVLAVLTFVLSNAAPGDFYTESRMDAAVDKRAVEMWRKQANLDAPVWRRFLVWSGAMAMGDWGISIASGLPVKTLVLPRVGNTLLVIGPAWLLSWIVGFSLAALSAGTKIWKWLERTAAAAQLLPEAIVASVVTWLAIVHLGLRSDGVLVPLLLVSLNLTTIVFLHSAGAMSAAYEARFVRLAVMAKVDRRVLLMRYVAPAVSHPLISLLGPSLLSAFSVGLVVEVVTGWPGVGSLFIDAFQARDYAITQAVLLMIGAMAIAFNLAADVLLRMLDPRLRVGEQDAN